MEWQSESVCRLAGSVAKRIYFHMIGVLWVCVKLHASECADVNNIVCNIFTRESR